MHPAGSVAPTVMSGPPKAVPAMSDQNRHGIADSTRAMWAERVKSRWTDLRAMRDAELHCRAVYALHRFSTPYAELSPRLQNVINQDVRLVLNIEHARLTDLEFCFLSHDARAKLEPEVGTAVRS